jgi:hypothetical protein
LTATERLLHLTVSAGASKLRQKYAGRQRRTINGYPSSPLR